MVRQRLERSKFSAVGLVQDHYETLRNYQTNRAKPGDYLVYLGIPTLVAVTSWFLGGQARNIPEVLAAVAILTGLIFNVFVLIFDLTARTADSLAGASRTLVSRLVDELRANVSYAVLVGLVLTVTLGGIAMFANTTDPLGRPATAAIVFAGTHMLLTVFMILKRVRATFRAFHQHATERIP